MDLLLVGASRFARRRVLPAAESIPEIEAIHVVSSHADAQALRGVAKLGLVSSDWRAALTVARPSLVYVSSINSDHAGLVRHALVQGHHVVVDKPALPDLETAEQMVALARASALVIAEATCYSFHPLFAAVRSVLATHNAEVTNVFAVFTPPVSAGDWRHERKKGGGALLDTGPYAVSLGRVLWGVEADRIYAIAHHRDDAADALETSYSMVAGYPGGRTILGQFGFTTTYQNMVRLTGHGFVIDVERPFSAPPGMAVKLRVQFEDQVYVRNVEPADSMRIFLSAVLAATATGSQAFGDSLLSDARALARLKQAAAFS